MRVRRMILRIVLIVVLLLVAAAGWMYWQAGRVPDAYKPAKLSRAERKAAAMYFINRRLFGDFNSIVQNTATTPFQLTEKELNRYLASMDEIAASHVGGKPGDVNQRMAEAGLTDPAVALRDGILTLMVHSTEFNRILSLDLAFVFAEPGKMKVVLKGIRVGDLNVPRSLVEGEIDKLKKHLRQRARAITTRRNGGSEATGAALEGIERGLITVIAAMDEAPISSEFTWAINKKRGRIEAIEIEKGLATLQIRPLGRDGRPDE